MTDRTNPGPKVAAHHAHGRGVTRIPYPIGVRAVTVRRREPVSSHMLRLTLGGTGLAGFESHAADDHVKIVFPREDGSRADPAPNDEQLLDWPHPLPPTRTYTVRRYDAEAQELDLDVVVHDGGLASAWAEEAAVGDTTVIAGPPGSTAFAHTYRHYVFAVDTTALPAAARWIEEADWLEEDGGTALLLVDHDHPGEVEYPLRERAGVEVRWLSRTGGSRLAEESMARAAGSRPPGEVFLFAAGEAGDIKPLRTWSRREGVDALVTGYWKRGVVDLDEG